MIGKIISHYKILDKLGEGGMGVVYKAEDTKLDRLVALKFLPKEIEADETGRARLLQEAKSASALSHPNVCIIYDLQEHRQRQFIVMMYVDGMTLRQKIKERAVHEPLLQVKDVLSYAIQIGEALEEAHNKGIVHRDIKSDNIMVTAKGQVKVMDFGLAKLKGVLHSGESTSTVGTLAYMPPEQLYGKETDARMDIFSFGVVLYEMLTGRLPFKGEYEAAIMYSILNTEPEPVTNYRPELSSEFLHLINRALEKNPDDRYQSISDMLIDLRRLKRDTSKILKIPSAEIFSKELQASGAMSIEQPETIVKVTGLKKAVLKPPLQYYMFVSLIIILTAAGYYMFGRDGKRPLPRVVEPLQVTRNNGVENYPTWSPNGKKFAYQWNDDIWVVQLPDITTINLTEDFVNSAVEPSWSTEGGHIAFRSYGENSEIYIIPAIGGTPYKVLTGAEGWGPPTWAPDGKRLACIVQDSVLVVSLTGDPTQRFHLPGGNVSHRYRGNLSWSPDGQLFAYTVGISGEPIHPTRLWVMRVTDGEAFQLSNSKTIEWSPHWSRDAKYLYYISNRGGRPSLDLWWQRIENDGSPLGEPQQITTGIEMRSASLSHDESRIAYSKGSTTGSLWRVAIPGDHSVTWNDAIPLTSEQIFIQNIDISRDGKELVFDSDRDGITHIWKMPVEGGEMQRVTIDPKVQFSPKWSPDGRRIAFVSIFSRNLDIGTTIVGSGEMQQVTTDSTTDHIPSWSPDGSEIVYQSARSGNLDIWIIPAEGGKARQVTTETTNDFPLCWSPDGKWILFRSDRKGEVRLWRIPVEGGRVEQVTEAGGWSGVYSPDGKKIYFIANEREGGSNIWEVPAEGGTERRLTDFSAKTGNMEGGLATDGKSLYFVWFETNADIWVMDVLEE